MAKKKRDFWDEVDEEVEVSSRKKRKADKKERYDDDDDYAYEGFHPTRNTPIKVIMRILMFIAAMVILVSGAICYKYVEDRYDDGFTTSYFGSTGFSEEYNKAVEQVIKIVSTVEADVTISESPEQLESLIESMIGQEGSFSFIVQNGEKQTLYKSHETAKENIEKSNHFLRISTADNNFTVDVGGVPTKKLNKEGWKTSMDGLQNVYIIYTAVDNDLQPTGAFYESYVAYQKLGTLFGFAKIAGIVAAVLFILLFIFCAIATGRQKGTMEIKLSWYDYVYTEFAAIITVAVLGGIIFGIWYVLIQNPLPKFQNYLALAGVVLFYIFLVRFYFSLVRRIKTGRFVGDSLIYRLGHAINMGLNHLPKALKVIIVILFLIALNGALVYALLFMRHITVNDIPVIFIVAPIVFVIELIAFISCLFGGVPEERDVDEYVDEEPEADTLAQIEEQPQGDWADVDFSSGIKGVDVGILPEGEQQQTQENVIGAAADRTVMLSQEETDMLKQRYDSTQAAQTPVQPVDYLGDAGAKDATVMMDTQAIAEAAPVEDDGYVDFIQLNKDVRKMYRTKLKSRTIGVTLRAPENPILLDIDKSNAIKVLSILFDNVSKYAQEGSRVYIEMYVQKDKMIYMMKNTISEELLGQISTELGESLQKSKKIVKAEGGKFITTIDGNVFKAGILLPIANA